MAKTEERIDKWLWAMRVFKTRSISTDACKKGRVSVGETVVKPSRMIKPGDVINVRKPPVTYSFGFWRWPRTASGPSWCLNIWKT